ncbi:MAG: hypothetical protein J3R72DRAFT_495847 [Linnemannia gamsii]|nr:MAG: hypothetical protein J3R72DRAFT_495847 [Linnemannia gamsii]
MDINNFHISLLAFFQGEEVDLEDCPWTKWEVGLLGTFSGFIHQNAMDELSIISLTLGMKLGYHVASQFRPNLTTLYMDGDIPDQKPKAHSPHSEVEDRLRGRRTLPWASLLTRVILLFIDGASYTRVAVSSDSDLLGYRTVGSVFRKFSGAAGLGFRLYRKERLLEVLGVSTSINIDKLEQDPIARNELKSLRNKFKEIKNNPPVPPVLYILPTAIRNSDNLAIPFIVISPASPYDELIFYWQLASLLPKGSLGPGFERLKKALSWRQSARGHKAFSTSDTKEGVITSKYMRMSWSREFFEHTTGIWKYFPLSFPFTSGPTR